MKKLKEKPISPFGIVFLIIFFVNCKGNPPKQENRGMRKDVSHEMTLTKDFFLNCTGARDTFFANGDYLKYIPINKEHAGIYWLSRLFIFFLQIVLMNTFYQSFLTH